MSYKPTDTAEKLVALLDNAKKLAVYHQRKTLAADAVEACKLFSEARSFPMASNQFDSLRHAVRGKMNSELSDMFDEMKKMVVAADMGTQTTFSGDKSYDEIARHIRAPG
jgi:hypothetical protein